MTREEQLNQARAKSVVTNRRKKHERWAAEMREHGWLAIGQSEELTPQQLTEAVNFFHAAGYILMPQKLCLAGCTVPHQHTQPMLARSVSIDPNTKRVIRAAGAA